MNKDSRATKWLMAAICLVVLAYFGLQAYRYFNDPLTTTVAYSYEAEEALSVTGWVVRDEQVLTGDTGGLLRLSRSEGERVSKGGEIARIYADQAALDQQTQIDALKTRLSQLEFAQSAASGGETTIKLDAQITEELLALRSLVAADRLDTADSRIANLRSLVLKRDYTDSGEGDLPERITQTKQELKTLESKASASIRTVCAPAAGIYSAVTDGYESVLTASFLEDLTPSDLLGVKPASDAASELGKLIVSETWYYAANLSTADAGKLEEGGTVTLRFSKGDDRNLTMRVVSLSAEENGHVAAVFSCREYLTELTMLRRQSASVILSTVEGIRIPSGALRVDEDGQAGVYCVVGTTARFKAVRVVYTGDGYVLVRPAAQDAKNPIRTGDEIVITALDLYDGKVIS